jgi:U3 small nucleolar RNA-associated protein 13
MGFVCAIGFNGDIVDLAALPDNKRVVVATNSAQLRLFDMNTFDAELITGHTNVVLSLDVSADGRFLVSSGKDNTVRFWQLNPTPRCICVCEGHSEAVGVTRFSRNIPSIKNPLFAVSGSRDRTLKVWNCAAITALSDGESKDHSEARDSKTPVVPITTRITKVAHDKDINAIAIAPHDRLIASGSQDKTIKLWTSADLTLVATLKGHRRGVWALEFSPVDKVLASGSGDNTIKIW